MTEASTRQTISPSNKLQIFTGTGLADFEERIRKAIAYRAYEIFESRGRRDGSDMADWFSAESELVKPVNVRIEEAGGRLHVRAGVAGFNHIQLGVAPARLIIWGEMVRPGNSAAHMLGEISLPVPIDSRKAEASLNGETLEFHAPEAAASAA